MAQLHEENIVITLSRAVREKGKIADLADAEFVATLENVVSELVGDRAIVEVKKA